MTRHAFLVLVMICIASKAIHAQNALIPNPEDVLGFKVGEDFRLADYEQSLDYFQKLDWAFWKMILTFGGAV